MKRLTTLVGLACIALTCACSSGSQTASNGKLYRSDGESSSVNLMAATRKSKSGTNGKSSKYGPRDPETQAKYRQIVNGMTYDAVIKIMGEPTKLDMRHTWTTVDGQVSVIFDWEGNQAQKMLYGRGVSRDAYQSIRALVDQGANYNTIAANIGSSPDRSKRRAVWEFPGDGRLRLGIDQADNVSSTSWMRSR
ncbi:hypothetical protein IQ266_13515 [filamentous cyanobacterium LEGE 11480]|uniref:DUF3862 domain-containing protein n=1 Tax=Romeriopsis navalis LEGE 11480 TaxID=2777977 RepID=A0A928VLX7_9CYAN|nr:hypothetical protein [Romeriopsis navalis]MBE9030750.1 hypothetical protein [Romeriopsis navalis LEGE 11480]